MSRACDAPHMKTHSKIFHQTTLFGDPSGVSLAQFSRFVTTFGCRPTNCGPLTTLREWRRANKRPWRRVSSPMAHRAGSIGEHYYIITLLHYYNVVTLFADEPPQQLYIWTDDFWPICQTDSNENGPTGTQPPARSASCPRSQTRRIGRCCRVLRQSRACVRFVGHNNAKNTSCFQRHAKKTSRETVSPRRPTCVAHRTTITAGTLIIPAAGALDNFDSSSSGVRRSQRAASCCGCCCWPCIRLAAFGPLGRPSMYNNAKRQVERFCTLNFEGCREWGKLWQVIAYWSVACVESRVDNVSG